MGTQPGGCPVSAHHLAHLPPDPRYPGICLGVGFRPSVRSSGIHTKSRAFSSPTRSTRSSPPLNPALTGLEPFPPASDCGRHRVARPCCWRSRAQPRTPAAPSGGQRPPRSPVTFLRVLLSGRSPRTLEPTCPSLGDSAPLRPKQPCRLAGHLWMMSKWCRCSRASSTWPSMLCIHWGDRETPASDREQGLASPRHWNEKCSDKERSGNT